VTCTQLKFADLNQFINCNNLVLLQPNHDRKKIILYIISKGFQHQQMENSFEYLHKINLQANADLMEALQVYISTGKTNCETAAPVAPPRFRSSSVPRTPALQCDVQLDVCQAARLFPTGEGTDPKIIDDLVISSLIVAMATSLRILGVS
jgi:hypothetical protein